MFLHVVVHKAEKKKGDTQRDTEGVLKDNAYIDCMGSKKSNWCLFVF